MRFCLSVTYIFTLIFLGPTAWAASNITVTDVDGASNFELPATGASGAPVIYGAIGGNDDTGACANAPVTSTTFCNSCTLEEVSCSPKRIHDNLQVKISFTVTGDISGAINVGYNDGNGVSELQTGDFTPSTTGSLSKNSQAYVIVDWGVLCGVLTAVDGTADCVSIHDGGGGGGDFTLYLSVGDIDTEANRISISIEAIEPEAAGLPDLIGCNDPDAGRAEPDVGLCYFEAVAGDEKVEIDAPETFGNCPSTGSSTVQAFRVFYSPIDFDSAGFNGATYKDLEVDSDCNPKGEWFIDGLQNETMYFFRAAIVDKAYNLAFLTDIDSGAADDAVATQGADCDPATPADAGCSFIATPGNVIGLLSENFNCFIATAAYGSPMHPMVVTLRKFRDQVLNPTKWGRALVKYYYAKSPAAARWIADKPIVKNLVRVALLPATAAAWFSMKYGITGLILMLVITAYGLIIFSRDVRAARVRVKHRANNGHKGGTQPGGEQ